MKKTMNGELNPFLLEAVNYLETLPLIEILTTNKHDESYFNQASKFIYNDIVKSSNYQNNIYYILSSSLRELVDKIKNDIKENFFNEEGNLQTDQQNTILYYLYVQALTKMLMQLNIQDMYDDIVDPSTIENIKKCQSMPLIDILEIDNEMVIYHLVSCIIDEIKNYPLYKKSKYYRTICDFIHKFLPKSIINYDKKRNEYSFNKMETTKRMHVVLCKLALQQYFDDIGLVMTKQK